MELCLATNNRHKAAEVRAKIAPLGCTVTTPAEQGLEFSVEETGADFRANAALKAEALFRLTGRPALADDSGLAVDALDGAPGVYSARYAGETADDAANNAKLLAALAGLPPDKRSAAFVCVLAWTTADGTVFFEGRCPGVITDTPRGEHGFGYDPLFFLPELGKTMAELSMDEKNACSHRARALAAFAAHLAARP